MADLFGSPEWQKLADDNPKEYYENTPFMRSLWEGRLPTWLGQAYEQDISPAIEAAPSPTTMEGALTYGKGAYNLAKGLVTGAVDTIDSAQKDPYDLKKVLDLSLMVTGGGGLLGRVPAGSGKVLGANVYQGGPHKYGPEGAAKSLDHMGKGEGAQAYGWGRYDAGAEGVAKEYQVKVPFQDIKRSFLKELPDDAEIEEVMSLLGKKHFSESQERVIRALHDDDWLGFDSPAAAISAVYSKNIDNWDPSDVLRRAVNDAGYLYKHDLPDEDIARYMDWDKPLSQQPESVRAALAKIVPDHKVKNVGGVQMLEVDGKWTTLDLRDSIPVGTVPDNVTGGEIYQYIQNVARRNARDANDIPSTTTQGSQQAASEALGRAGIPGLKYYDQMSRQAATGRGLHITPPSDTVSGKWMVKGNDPNSKGMHFDTEEAAKAALKEQLAAQTRNYVTWDQDVLDRMKLLERNGESMIDALR
jgi:hypothetical protein